MSTKWFGAIVATIILSANVRQAVAQARPGGPPTNEQAQALLQRPDIIRRLQSLMQSSGMTRDQVRARLRAEGYDESLLDSYFPGATGDTTAVPSDAVLDAVRALGVGDSASVDNLRRSLRGQRQVDSAFLDTIARASLDDSTRAALRRVLRSRETQRAQLDSGFSIYGLDIFSRETSQFSPNVSTGVDPNYRLGPGDHLVLFLTGDTEKSYQLEVTRGGFIVIPEIGQIPVSNLTLGQLEDQLYSQFGRVYSRLGRGPNASTRLSVNVGRVGSNQIFVTGDVVAPGSYTISRSGTALNALYAAGGPTAVGSLRQVQVRRGDQILTTFDVYDYALRGDASRDVRLESGDIVFVPPRGGDVRVAGAVARPATYELRPGETLADVIRMAGGFTPTADRSRVQIERILAPTERVTASAARRTIEVASTLLTTGFGPPEPMSPGDIVHVFALPRRITNRVVVGGNVWTPGPVALTSGMHLSDALRRAGGLKPDSYLGEVLITRLLADSSRKMLRAALLDTTGTAANDISLADADEIRVFSLTDFRPQTFVTISGAVKKSGQVAYREGMTLRDLVMLSGGLTEDALLTQAEIARLPESRARGVTAVTQRVPLDSTYVLGRSSVALYPGAPGEPAPAMPAPDVILRPYDAVLILRQTNWEPQRIVVITGEVRYPGPYALRTTTERLSDVIERAGGLTDRAYGAGTTFLRRKGGVGRVGLDLPAVLRDPNDRDNLELTGGDSINVPVYAPIVQVTGAVNSPVAVAYVPGQDIDYYIRAAGGRSATGEAKRAFVTQANGKIESRRAHLRFWHSDPHPGAGSTVTVPEQSPNDKIDYSAVLATTASILGSLVAIVAIVRR